MDDALRKRLERVEEQIGVVYEAEEKHLTLEAAKEHFKATLVATASGTSQAARETAAEATPEWKTFCTNLAVAKAIYHREKHTLELKNNAFMAEYGSYKMEHETIRKQQ